MVDTKSNAMFAKRDLTSCRKRPTSVKRDLISKRVSLPSAKEGMRLNYSFTLESEGVQMCVQKLMCIRGTGRTMESKGGCVVKGLCVLKVSQKELAEQPTGFY